MVRDAHRPPIVPAQIPQRQWRRPAGAGKVGGGSLAQDYRRSAHHQTSLKICPPGRSERSSSVKPVSGLFLRRSTLGRSTALCLPPSSLSAEARRKHLQSAAEKRERSVANVEFRSRGSRRRSDLL